MNPKISSLVSETVKNSENFEKDFKKVISRHSKKKRTKKLAKKLNKLNNKQKKQYTKELNKRIKKTLKKIKSHKDKKGKRVRAGWLGLGDKVFDGVESVVMPGEDVKWDELGWEGVAFVIGGSIALGGRFALRKGWDAVEEKYFSK